MTRAKRKPYELKYGTRAIDVPSTVIKNILSDLRKLYLYIKSTQAKRDLLKDKIMENDLSLVSSRFAYHEIIS